MRAGNYQQALQHLNASHEATWFGQGIAHPLVAIAHHQLGNEEDALQAFSQSHAFHDRLLDESVARQSGAPTIPWVDWVEFLLNHRQASIIIKGHTPAIDPRLRQMEESAAATVAE